ncbi:MAG: HEPN domain-containing protein [Candidatus Cloacimonadales bacterium]|nr:HEPN domain-containing protein [Candidatus Cloacimonadales bacterium]
MNEAYCPLENFYVDFDLTKFLGDSKNFNIHKDLIITTEYDRESFGKIQSGLTTEEIECVPKVWLKINADCDFEELTSYINIFQLALLITKPTKVKIPYKFNEFNISRYGYQFNFIKKYTYKLTKKDILKVSEIYPVLLKIYQNDSKINRLKSAMVDVLSGCLTITWNSAYVLYMISLETLLTEGSKFGVKKKLASAYAILTENDLAKRQQAFKDFIDIYKIRSDIVHGKSFNDKYNDGNLNLKELAKCRDMLRKLWQVILSSEEIIEKLSGNDKVRRKYFNLISGDWMPKEKCFPLKGKIPKAKGLD